MQLVTEKVLSSVQGMLSLIGEVRSQVVLMHDYTEIKRETKLINDEVRRENEATLARVEDRYRQAERLEGEIVSSMSEVQTPKEVREQRSR